jgi:hypothetical protein
MSYEIEKQQKLSFKIDTNVVKFRQRSITNNYFERGGIILIS